jgi:hypothetical protein
MKGMKGMKLKSKLSIKLPETQDSSDEFEFEFPQEKKAKFECSEITKNISLSGYSVSLDENYLKNNGFTHIINCAANSKCFKTTLFNDIEYLCLNIEDKPSYDLSYYFYLVIDFIEKTILNNQDAKILIHCYEVKIFYFILYNFRANQEHQLYLLVI